MSQVLVVLNALCAVHDAWFYRVRDHFRLHHEYYNIDLFIDDGHKIVISAVPAETYVEVWCDTQRSEDDGVRVKKSALLEYLLFIIAEEYSD